MTRTPEEFADRILRLLDFAETFSMGQDKMREALIREIEDDRGEREKPKRKFGHYQGKRVEILSRTEYGIFSTYRIATPDNLVLGVYCDEVSRIEEES